MISIITAIYNGLPVNKLFLKYIQQNTHHPYELIIIDNGSTDGSLEFFRENGAVVIANPGNFSYPYCQNQGIKEAKYNVFAFLNNDIIVAPSWDKHLLEVAEHQGLEIITTCGVEHAETYEATKWLKRRWNIIKNIISIFGLREETLALMHKLMYGNWEGYCEKRWAKFKFSVLEGFVGHSVLMKRSAIEKVGLWDERIQAADFDLYMRSKQRHLEKGDIKPCCIALGVINHHFIRITLRSNPPVFKDKANQIRLEDKWDDEKLKLYLKDAQFH